MKSGDDKNIGRKTQGREQGSREPAICPSEGSRLSNRLVPEQRGCQGSRSTCEPKIENNGTETRQESAKLQALGFNRSIKLVLQG